MHSAVPAPLLLNRDQQNLENKLFSRPSPAAETVALTPRGKQNARRPRPSDKADSEPSTASLVADAKSFLLSVAGDVNEADSPAAWCQSVADKVRRTSRAQHLKAIALCHAFVLRLDSLPGRELVLRDLERAIGRKRSARTRDIHIIVENFVDYAVGTSAERAAARKLLSRDSRAVEHLRTKKIPPSEVEALARRKGEGLDRWSRRAAVPRSKAKQSTSEPALSPKQEAHQRGLRHVLLHVVRDADGTEVGRERFAVTGVLDEDVKAALQVFKKLGS